MVASTIGTTNARSEAGRATSQSPVVEHSASGQQEGNTPDNLDSRQASDPTNDTWQAGISSPSLGDMSPALAAWEDPSIQGWGYWPPEPNQPSASPGETSTGSAALDNTSTSATLTITIFDETLYFDPPQPPVHLGPPHVCPICGRRYMRPSCLSTHMNIHSTSYSSGNKGRTLRFWHQDGAVRHRYRYSHSRT